MAGQKIEISPKRMVEKFILTRKAITGPLILSTDALKSAIRVANIKASMILT
jgi:hypothetical protein